MFKWIRGFVDVDGKKDAYSATKVLKILFIYYLNSGFHYLLVFKVLLFTCIQGLIIYLYSGFSIYLYSGFHYLLVFRVSLFACIQGFIIYMYSGFQYLRVFRVSLFTCVQGALFPFLFKQITS